MAEAMRWLSGGAPGAGRAGALESCRAALGMEKLGPSELSEISHRIDMDHKRT
jgi:hypothetical protein